LLLFFYLCLAPDAPAGPVAASRSPAAFDTVVKPFLTRNCYLCHNDRLKNADVNLQSYPTAASIGHDPQTWEKAVMMRTRQMPRRLCLRRATESPRSPAGSRPSSSAPTGDPGPTREDHRPAPEPDECDNTVRDLLGVTLRPASDFPDDRIRLRQRGRRALALPVLMNTWRPPSGSPRRALRPRRPHARWRASNPWVRSRAQRKPLSDYDATG
jgi:hypothetical protein